MSVQSSRSVTEKKERVRMLLIAMLALLMCTRAVFAIRTRDGEHVSIRPRAPSRAALTSTNDESTLAAAALQITPATLQLGPAGDTLLSSHAPASDTRAADPAATAAASRLVERSGDLSEVAPTPAAGSSTDSLKRPRENTFYLDFSHSRS